MRIKIEEGTEKDGHVVTVSHQLPQPSDQVVTTYDTTHVIFIEVADQVFVEVDLTREDPASRIVVTAR